MRIKRVLWISGYTVAQRVTDRFYDGKRVLLVGDACHTNSPKVGQGMNTGIHDAYNLAWKLALVLRGRAHLSLLETYNLERRHIALQLIEFDKRFSTLFADQSEIAKPEFRGIWAEHRGFASGLSHQYPESSLVRNFCPGANTNVDTEANTPVEPIVPGKRFLPMRLIRHIDGWDGTSLDIMPCNGEFHLIVFAGDIATEPQRSNFNNLYDTLTSPHSTMTKYNGFPHESLAQNICDKELGPGSKAWPWEDIHTSSQHEAHSNKFVNLCVVHTSSHFDVELRPRYEEWMCKFFKDRGALEHRRHGVDEKRLELTIVLVRPDGVVGQIFSSPMEIDRELQRYFERAGMKPVGPASQTDSVLEE